MWKSLNIARVRISPNATMEACGKVIRFNVPVEYINRRQIPRRDYACANVVLSTVAFCNGVFRL